MSFKPSNWYLGSVHVFGSLIPGAICLYLGGRALELWSVASVDVSPNSQLGWAGFLVASFIIGRLAHEPAHILNLLYDHVYAPHRRSRGDANLDWIRATAGEQVGPQDSYYAWARGVLAARAQDQLALVDMLEGVSKMFRTICLAAFMAAVLAPFVAAWLLAVALLFVGALSFLVFAEQRFAASKLLYQLSRSVIESAG